MNKIHHVLLYGLAGLALVGCQSTQERQEFYKQALDEYSASLEKRNGTKRYKDKDFTSKRKIYKRIEQPSQPSVVELSSYDSTPFKTRLRAFDKYMALLQQKQGKEITNPDALEYEEQPMPYISEAENKGTRTVKEILARTEARKQAELMAEKKRKEIAHLISLQGVKKQPEAKPLTQKQKRFKQEILHDSLFQLTENYRYNDIFSYGYTGGEFFQTNELAWGNTYQFPKKQPAPTLPQYAIQIGWNYFSSRLSREQLFRYRETGWSYFMKDKEKSIKFDLEGNMLTYTPNSKKKKVKQPIPARPSLKDNYINSGWAYLAQWHYGHKASTYRGTGWNYFMDDKHSVLKKNKNDFVAVKSNSINAYKAYQKAYVSTTQTKDSPYNTKRYMREKKIRTPSPVTLSNTTTTLY